ncbi:MAG: M20 family metallopeptidase [Kiritimatiellaeota bacterium]|nr:M20 family metallopeptidase [Kiritimatiellota bacterium]
MRDGVELLCALAACRPVSADVSAVNHAVDLLWGELEEAGLHIVVEELAGRRILYAATEPGCTRPEVLLNAHLDVVPAEPEQYEIRETDGRLYGRGACDCLGNCVVAARVLHRLKGRASVGAVFSSDEEIGGETTAAMVERGYGATRLVLVMDGGGYALTVGQKGVLTVRLRARGVACHAAEPWKGENAIDRLIAGYLRVRKLFPEVQPPDTWQNTLVASRLSAGTVSNRVPDAAEMTLNVRFTEQSTAADLLEQLVAASGLDADCLMECPPVAFSPDTPILRCLVEHMQRFLDRPIEVNRLNGATDARHFVRAGVPIGIIGLPGADVHGAGEFVERAALAMYEEMLAGFIGARPWA